MIFLDNSRTTRLSKAAEEVFFRLSKENVLSIEQDPKLLAEMEKTYEILFDLVGAKDEDAFYFTSGETQAATTVLHGVLFEQIAKTGKNHILTLATENASILQAMDQLEKVGCEGHYLTLNEKGQVTPEMVAKAINPRTSILALSWVHPLTGIIQPIWEIAKVCKERDVLLYVQASEIFAKLSFRFQDIDMDFLSFSADKFHGPKGAGGLFVKKGVKHSFPIKGKESANIPAFIAMGVAFQENLACMDSMGTEIARLLAHFEDHLSQVIPEVVFFGRNAPRIPNTTCFAIPSLHAELLAFHLKHRAIYLSLGGGENQKLEYILREMHISPQLAKGAMSLTLSIYTTEQEIDALVTAIADTLTLCKDATYD